MPRYFATVSFIFMLGTLSSSQAFLVPRENSVSYPTKLSTSSSLGAKGFGSKDSSSSSGNKKQKTESVPSLVKEEPTLSSSAASANPFAPAPASTSESDDMELGKAALEKMRRERAEKRNEELRRVQEVQDVDAMLRETPEAAVIPEKVAQRMGKRMLPFVGLPLFGAMGSFVGFWYMATYRDMEFQPALVAASTIALLAIGLVGITYSIMSASWDPDREGDVLGTEEFGRNVENIKSGLSRSRENAVLRDRMSEIPPSEFANLEKKEAAKEKRQQSFQDKFGDQLE